MTDVLFFISPYSYTLQDAPPREAQELSAVESDKEKTKFAKAQSNLDAGGATTSTGGKSNQTLDECLQRRVVTWHVDSPEYKLHVTSLLNMLINTGD